MYKRKQLINEIANKVFEHLLLEVGEGVKPYDFEVTNDSKNRMEMTFTIPPDTEHDAPDVMRVVFDVDVEIQGNVQIVLSFETITGSYENINRNQVYKTMSTIVACTEYFLQKRSNVQLLVYDPTDERREKLYSAYLKKALQTTKLGDKYEELPGRFGLIRKINSVSGISFIDLIQKEERKELEGVNLQSYPLSGAYLRHARLQHANLQHAELERAQLQHAQLQHAQLQHAYLQYAQLQHANLKGADLTGVQNLETCEGLDTVKYDEDTIWPAGFDIHKYQK